jgi:hypothetical protein
MFKSAGAAWLGKDICLTLLFRFANFKLMTRDGGFDKKTSFSKNTCLRYI